MLRLPQRAGLETLYAALLILRRGLPFSSINALPCLKTFLIPAESCIFKWNGYKLVQKQFGFYLSLTPSNSPQLSPK
ncbi:hypothetical protein CXF85_18235 [Colwellia sp. 75C3]|nr:hypothetical protein CXF85_18235 [Colwellia sp. 75C3]